MAMAEDSEKKTKPILIAARERGMKILMYSAALGAASYCNAAKNYVVLVLKCFIILHCCH